MWVLVRTASAVILEQSYIWIGQCQYNGEQMCLVEGHNSSGVGVVMALHPRQQFFRHQGMDSLFCDTAHIIIYKMNHIMRKPYFAFGKAKVQIKCIANKLL